MFLSVPTTLLIRAKQTGNPACRQRARFVFTLQIWRNFQNILQRWLDIFFLKTVLYLMFGAHFSGLVKNNFCPRGPGRSD
jgi:hypothetical protein